MFKILTVFTLIYCLTSSALQESENQYGALSSSLGTGENNQNLENQKINTQKREQRQLGLCSNENGLKEINADAVHNVNSENEKEPPNYKASENELDLTSHKDENNFDHNQVKVIEPPTDQDEYYPYIYTENEDTKAQNLLGTKQQHQFNSYPYEPTYQSELNKGKLGDKTNLNENENQNDFKRHKQPTQHEAHHKASPNCPPAISGDTRRATNDDKPVLPVESNTNDNQNLNDLKLKQANKDPEASKRRFALRPFNDQLANPEKGVGIVPISPSVGLSILDHNRVCYACSSVSNPTCMYPSRMTTVKYCLKGHDSCVTKTYETGQDKDSVVLVRDCAASCDDTNVPGIKYKACKVCHSNICNDDPMNGAFSINGHSFIFTLFLMFLIKYTI